MHGDLTNVVRALDEERPDLLLCCGDWGDPGEVDPDAFAGIRKRVPVLTVYGNHDDLGLLAHAVNSDGSRVLLTPGEVRDRNGLTLAGISGIWAKSHREQFYATDEDVDRFASVLAGRGVDVLLTHGCPIGLADAVPGGRRGGQRCFLDAFHTVKPRLYLCGHLHVPQKRELKDGRLVVNVGYTCEGDYWTFDIDAEHLEHEHHKLR
jgi:Icc-related predicted phosphoesterase